MTARRLQRAQGCALAGSEVCFHDYPAERKFGFSRALSNHEIIVEDLLNRTGV
jgi:hypothetical protein